MKIPLALGSQQPLSRAGAWGCLVANLCVLPGLGSLIAGRASGIGQMVFSLVGVVLTAVFAVAMISAWLDTHQLPRELSLYFWLGLAGVLFFGIGWIWALISSIHILRDLPSSQPPVAGS